MKVEYVDHMGSDLTVVNAARVSFDKYKEEFEESDEKLIRFLARNNHWTPFGHPMVSVRVTVPIFVARQLFKHKVGMVENEVSRRYVDDTPELFTPDIWRGRPTEGAKQGSSGEVFQADGFIDDLVQETYTTCINTYESLLEKGVAPEQARMVLPQSMYTSWIWTGSLSAFARIYILRIDPHAQKETQEIAQMLNEIIEPLFPVSWKELTKNDK